MDYDKNGVAKLIDQLLKYCADSSGGKHNQKDDYAYFIHFFMNKMITHGRSLLLLYQTENSDILLIVRSIIEGCALLKYASNNKQIIASKWRRHLYIAAFQEIKSIQGKDFPIDASENENRIEYINENCSDFIVENGRYIKIGNTKYAQNWYYPKSISQIVKELPNSVFKNAYSDYSAWHHWSPLSQFSSIESDHNTVNFKLHSSFNSSLVVGLSALMTSFSIFFRFKDDSYSINYLSEIEEKISKFLPY